MTADDRRPVPWPVLMLAYAALCGEELTHDGWFALTHTAGCVECGDTIDQTIGIVVRAVLIKAVRHGVARACEGVR